MQREGNMVHVLKKALRKAAKTFQTNAGLSGGTYKLHSYVGKNGAFDYERYRKIQTEGNKSKIGNVWVKQENIRAIADYLKTRNSAPTFGLCHGTRRGLEQKWFSEELGCPVLGTEISDTATQFPNTVQQDFHEARTDWLSACDFIYSNSFDHSFDPAKALRTWVSCLKPGGVVVIEHSSAHEASATTERDPFGAALHLMPYLVLQWSDGDFFVTKILDMPAVDKKLSYTKALIIEARN
jgi:hypothetical protein